MSTVTTEEEARVNRLKLLQEAGFSVGDSEMMDDTARVAVDTAVKAFVDVINRNRVHLPFSEEARREVGGYAVFMLHESAKHMDDMLSNPNKLLMTIMDFMKEKEIARAND